MRVSIFGLGYVGIVSAACLARRGHEVVGVDPIQLKVDLVNSGVPPVAEAGLAEILSAVVPARGLRATSDASAAVRDTDLSLICVGTPSQPNGDLETGYLERVCEQIGRALQDKAAFHVVVVRSTVLPGTTRSLVIPTLEAASRKVHGRDFGVCVNPEFLREGTAVDDFEKPPKTVIGESDPASGDRVASLYTGITAPLVRIDVATAEMVKYTDNAWHALKVGFANEVGNICKALALDSHRVMEIFCRDSKLNLSPAYLRPGSAFGGSCLPKDLRALTYKARSLDIEVPILSSILPSNHLQIQRALQMVLSRANKRVAILGFSFKAGTDDLRESPIVEIIERLLGKGYDLRIYDRSVSLSRLVGANREFLMNHIPHISQLMVGSIDEAVAHGDTLVIANGDPEFGQVLGRLREGQVVVDLVRPVDKVDRPGGYDGICW